MDSRVVSATPFESLKGGRRAAGHLHFLAVRKVHVVCNRSVVLCAVPGSTAA